ncbi:MAG: 4-hydroxythreonine-4-phosphate dehydrogenase PdxA [Chloroflexi bacterium]|nr:4-hydroxythreonine-4-phosphate dehydrogenase PdxA [Chloroflexota bacterium]
MADKKPVIGITLGDPAGIGPEIVLGALKSPEVYAKCVPVVIGHAGILRRCSDASGISAGLVVAVNSPRDAKGAFGVVEVFHVETPGMQDIQPGVLSADAGRAADAFVRRACELGLAGQIDAITTTPINKESLRLGGVSHIGHTEMLSTYLGAPNPLTLFITENMRIFFLSRHLSLREAIDYITAERVYEFIKRVHATMTDFGFVEPKIGLAALNPHASDGGQFGDEEAIHLIPATQRARLEGINVSGPVGADSVFNMALEGRFDCVISLYHDQGHIAAKTRDFHGTVTATLGLPMLRTSVDHGTAFDIAWKGLANPVSMKAAIIAAAEMLKGRKC